MRPVIRITLNGRELQLEDDAHALLTQYLESARRTLEGNPDRAEILADLEESIGAKAAKFLGGAREVLDREQIGIVLDAVGPVEPMPNGAASEGSGGASYGRANAGATGTSGATGTTGGADAGRNRPGQVSEGAMISGVCNGLAKWLSVDVTILRIVAVVLAFVTGGAAVLAYLLLMIILPYDDGLGAARGLPRKARSLVERLRGQVA